MTDNYDPYSAAPIGHNRPPLSAYETVKQEIEDLFDEAKHFADGDPIDSQELADAITKLHDSLHEAGKRADEARKDEAKPHDDAKAEIQARYNLLIGNTKTTGKGKVVLGKETLQTLLTPWRTRVAAEKEAAAKAAREEADRIAREAQEAMRASAGNLEEREKAEELLAVAKKADRWAKREDRSATTGTGLRTIWHCTLENEGKALDWAYGLAPDRFKELVQSMAEETVRAGMRQVPGFKVWDERVAR
ncbi:hypothetical protein H7Q97_17930 [Ochrobactrum sp. CM-21-5]|nr:hypothetical protein [Ochrobactrum sp. CM-21-5]MBC2887263.1 hypothetical protein [Ochrobactrum sp. CM-21-5]